MVNRMSGVRVTRTQKQMEDEYEDAKKIYGEDEAIHFCADLWGVSTFRVNQYIEEWNNIEWL
tara:strand:+ start:1004 stop:1189 length:186 start_codon:yes stop_codon:yes gene_type:complete